MERIALTIKSCLLFITACTAAATLCYAEQDIIGGATGSYVGFQVGGTRVHGPEKYLPNIIGVPVLTQPSNNGMGFRFYWGYQFSSYLGFEGGYAYYSPSTYKIPNGNSPQLRLQTIDFLGKGILPLFAGMNAFVKGGIAMVFYKQGGLLAPSSTGASGSSGMTARPEVGGGISYNFTPNWSVDATMTRITKGGVIPNSDMYTLGLTYHAVDLYCGQFLC